MGSYAGPMELRRLALVLCLGAASFLLFVALDRRDPNDHDSYYADPVIRSLEDASMLGAGAGAGGDLGPLISREFVRGGDYPPLARISLFAAMRGLGETRAVFRGLNLPFLLVMVLGTWLLGRQLGGARVGLLAALLVIGIPSMLVHSRKFAPPWHAAALTPLAWALLFLAARERGRVGWTAAVAGGFVQGARSYVHPIVYPDIALSSALVGLWVLARAFRSRSRAALMSLGRVVLAVGIALLLSSHVLGWELFGPSPDYSFERYRASRAHILAGGVDPAAMAVAGWAFVSDWFSMHLLPTGFVLAFVGGLAACWRLLRGPRDESWSLGLLLLLGLLAQLPLMLLAISRGTFTSDWMLLEPAACVLAAWAVVGGAEALRGWRRLWAGLAGSHSLVILFGPILLGLLLPGPFAHPALWFEGPPSLIARSSSGTVWNTHLTPISEPGALRRIVRALGDREASEDVRVVDLTLREVDLGVRCEPRLRANSSWVWGAPRGQDLENRHWSPWPARFEGAAPVAPAFTNDGSVGTPGWRGPPREGDPVLRLLGQSRGPIVLRLWLPLDATQRDAWRSCGVSRPDEELLASAKAQLSPHLPGYRWSEPLFDLGNELVGMEDGRARDPLYLSRAYLLQP